MKNVFHQFFTSFSRSFSLADFGFSLGFSISFSLSFSLSVSRVFSLSFSLSFSPDFSLSFSYSFSLSFSLRFSPAVFHFVFYFHCDFVFYSQAAGRMRAIGREGASAGRRSEKPGDESNPCREIGSEPRFVACAVEPLQYCEAQAIRVPLLSAFTPGSRMLFFCVSVMLM